MPIHNKKNNLEICWGAPMYKLSSYFLAMAMWIGLGFLSASSAQSELIINQDILREYCTVSPAGQRICERVQSEFVKSEGPLEERCRPNADGQTVCETLPVRFVRCIVTTSGRQVCQPEAAPGQFPQLSGESRFSDENRICTEGPQGVSCVSRHPPTRSSCASVRCAQGHSCIESPTGPQCVAEAPKLTCANALCSEGHHCIESTTGPQCVPNAQPKLTCANALCTEGHRCVESPTGPQCVADQPQTPPWNPSVCPAIYKPVCGLKGNLQRSFGNDCEARREGYSVISQGTCWNNPAPTPPQKSCPYNYAPVCAEKQVQCVRAPCPPQRQTFPNSCAAEIEDFTVIHQGSCRAEQPAPEQTICPYVYQPVCGQRGFERQTFSNSCVASRDNFSVIYQGQCR